ncbi:MAG: sugar phosphate nucleotidyltransferase [Ignavibacteria bacterium]|nr:MAG: nucleotidyl transferase [Chlorobiota bacterium]MBV6399492.1 Bifunctional protein GlmU [Ignavibacteria bacterium]MCC6886664.1 NTP transferase domain-containing protein [Ignavibacteriales bacterium]MCE7953198.1 nucleotidyl transferase [Chlorobi bacterium CHB7]RIK50066.1 MAG: nucleotidyl transferase [Ignavibacteriota bacterium]
MKIIIPVAGFGTRLRPHTLVKPKVLLNVAGKPMIHYIVEQLINDKIGDEIIFITGFLGEQIEKYINSEFAAHKRKFRYIVQEVPHGLGHAIYCAEPAFKKDEETLIILGDTLFDVDLKKLVDNKYSVIGTKRVDNPQRFGVVEKNKSGFITRMVEKPASPEVSPSKDAIVGIYFLKSSKLLFDSLHRMIEKDIRTKGEYQLTDALEMMIDRGIKMKTYNVHGWLDCGKPETLLQTNSYILKHIIKQKKYNFPGSVIIPPVFIHPSAEILNSIIGPDASISKNCKIKNSIVGNSTVNDNTEITNALVFDSVIGHDVKLKLETNKYNIGDNSEIDVQ